MRYPTRLTKLLLGVAVVALGGACAGSGARMDAGDPGQSAVIDRALQAARTARTNGDLDTAAARLAYLVSIAPDNESVEAEYGKVLTEMGRPDDAFVFFRRAKALKSDDWTIYNAEGVAYDEKHDFKSAQADYAKALELKPDEPAILNDDARSHMMAGDLKGAEGLLAQTYPTDDRNGYLTDTQAQLSAMEVTTNSNAPAEALTPDMAVKAPPEAPAPQPLAPALPAADAVQAQSPPAAAPTAEVEVKSAATAILSGPPAAGSQPAAAQAPTIATPAPKAAPTAESAQAATVAAAASASTVAAVPRSPAQTAASVPTPAPAVATDSPAAVTAVQAAASSEPALKQGPTVTSVAPIAEQAPSAPEATVTPKAVGASAPAVVEKGADKPVGPQPAMSAGSPEQATPAPAPVTTTPEETAQPLTSAHAEKLAVVARAEPIAAAPKAVPLYAISVGAFAMRNNADALTAKLASHDAKAVPVVVNDVTFWRVELGSLNSDDAARAALVDVRALGYADARVVTSGPAANEHVYIRVGTFGSRHHAWHVAARLRPRDAHIARVTRDGRHYYRVWIPVGDRPDAELALAEIRAKGYRLARMIVRLGGLKHLAAARAATVIASGAR